MRATVAAGIVERIAMRSLILCLLIACSRKKHEVVPLRIDDEQGKAIATLTVDHRVLDATGHDVGVFDPVAREVTIGAIRQPVKFTNVKNRVDVVTQLGTLNVVVTGERVSLDGKSFGRLSGFHDNWLELAALMTAIPALPVPKPIDAGLDATSEDVPPPPPPPPPPPGH